MKTRTTFFALLITILFSITLPFSAQAEGDIFDVSFSDYTPTSFHLQVTMESSVTFPSGLIISVMDPNGITVFWSSESISERISSHAVTGLLPNTNYQVRVNSQGGGSWNVGLTTPAVTGIDDNANIPTLTATVVGSSLMMTASTEMLGKKGFVYDYTGKPVSGFVIENIIQNIDISGLPKGFYLISTDKLAIRIVIMN